ncbi:MAG: hypothetical protein KC502_18070 [Myxococcales bacterium]|nr:hypothetical protein [Myxococcales bacterium]
MKASSRARSLAAPLAVCLLALCVAPGLAHGASPRAEVCRAVKAGGRVNVDMTDAKLPDVVRMVSCWLRLDLVVGPGLKGRKITLIAPKPIRQKEILPLLQAALQTAGMRLDLRRRAGKKGHRTPRYGVVRKATPVQLALDAREVRLKHVRAEAAARALTRLLSLPAAWVPVVRPQRNSLVLGGDPAVQRTARTWLAWLDVPGPQRQIYLVRVRHRQPGSLVPLLETVVARRHPGTRIVADERGRRLIVLASKKAWRLLDRALVRLDRPAG